MSPTWDSGDELEYRPIGFCNYAIFGVRVACAVVVLITGVLLMGLLRLIEAPLFKLRRPVTPRITVLVCRLLLLIFGLRVERRGRVCDTGALVSNHSSWLDILVLNAQRSLFFVSKAEVAGWPGIGLLARITGTHFVERERRAAQVQVAEMTERLSAGQVLLFFPEGTSTDGRRVLPFKTTLFDPLFRSNVPLQPVTVSYGAPADQDARFYGWWGGMDLGPSLLHILGQIRQGKIIVTFHDLLIPAEYTGRKALANAAEECVRGALSA